MKTIIKLSMVAALATSVYASTDLQAQIDELKAQLAKTNKKLTKVKTHDSMDNLKLGVDFRTAVDSIHYDHVSGATSSNPDLLTNRLWINMGYAPSENLQFHGKLSYLKAYGDTANHSQSNTNPGYADFDWVTNENATDGTVKVKEAFWFYKNDTFLDANVPWTLSIGRRPSTDGLGINLREGMKANSPLSHTVNVEFDGLSSKFDLENVTGVEGMSWKLCIGRGLTNAKPRFQNDGSDYAKDDTQTSDNNMYGFIFVPYDNGQYSVWTNWARSDHMIGFEKEDMDKYGMVLKGYDPTDPTMQTKLDPEDIPSAQMAYAPQFKDFGSIDLLTAMFKAEGIGDGINDFLDDTRFFGSWAMSQTDPAANMKMLGSTDSKTGNSAWLGLNMPCPLTDDGRVGVEWNKGSKYWRSITYGEDTMAGSKIAARGTAWEVYYTKPLMKGLYFNARYTKIDYDYTGSNSFFGEDGTPYTIAEAKAAYDNNTGADVVESATDLHISVSYKF